jgi:hypothetical protein
MARLRSFLYTIASPVAGLAVLCLTLAFTGSVALVLLPYLAPGSIDEDGQPENVVGKIAFCMAGCLACAVGGYVAAWLAGREKLSEVKSAVAVGLISGAFVVLSNNDVPIPWVLLGVSFATSVLVAVLGGFLRAWQVRRRSLGIPRNSGNSKGI